MKGKLNLYNSLEPGMLIQFVSFPRVWANPEYRIERKDVDFMHSLIEGKRYLEVKGVEDGKPFVEIEIASIYHKWFITEPDGWIVVN